MNCERKSSAMKNGDFEIKDGVLVRYHGEERFVGLPPGLLAVGEGAFRDCRSLEEVYIPDGVAEIGREAFQWCANLKRVAAPASVTEVGRGAFAGTPYYKFYCENETEWREDFLFIGRCLVKARRNLRRAAIPEGTAAIAAVTRKVAMVTPMILPARFALCKFFHDSGILFVELIQQADDQNADKDQQRAKHIDVDDRVDCGLRLHNSAAGRGNIAAQTHNACNACLCDAGAQLGADRTACEDEALLTDVVLPLAKLDNVTDHAEYKGAQRCFADAAQHGGEQAPAEAGGVEEEQSLTDQYKDGACYDHVALAERIAQQRTQGHNDNSMGINGRKDEETMDNQGGVPQWK